MISLLKNLCCLYILLDVLNGYEHILDRSTVRDGGRFSISCNLRRAHYGKPVSGVLTVATITRKIGNTSSTQIIVKCGLNTELRTENFSRPWIFKGLNHCDERKPDFLITVEVTDAKCSDATRYSCLGLYLAGSEFKGGFASEELRRDASCDNMEVDMPNGTSANQETTTMLRQLVAGAIVILHRLYGSLLLGLS